MSEKNFWTLLRKNLPLKMYRVENKVSTGMPDVHFVSEEGLSGWVELKFIAKFPQRQMTTGLKKHQAMWLEEYSKYGKAWVLIRIATEWTGLFSGEVAQELFARPSKSDFCDLAAWSKHGNLTKGDYLQLSEILCKGSRYG
jgi:hypothetical protein